MKLVTVVCFCLLLTELCFSQCDQNWELVSGKCVMCGPDSDDLLDGTNYCSALGATFGSTTDQNLLEFAKTCIENIDIQTGLRVKLVNGQPVRFWNDGTPYTGPLPATSFDDAIFSSKTRHNGCYFAAEGTNVWRAEDCCCGGFFCVRDLTTSTTTITTNTTAAAATTTTADSDGQLPLVMMSTVAVGALLALAGAIILALRANAPRIPALGRRPLLRRPARQIFRI